MPDFHYVKAYAHIQQGEDGRWKKQALQDHLEGVACRAAGFAEVFKSAEWGRYIGRLHDVGKFFKDWQDYLCYQTGYDLGRKGRKGQHSTAGALVAEYQSYLSDGERMEEAVCRVAEYCIAGHHAGLPDWWGGCGAALAERIGEAHRKELPDSRDAQQYLHLDMPDITPAYLHDPSDLQFWTRMLFSCLVDADGLDTEEFCNPEQNQQRGQYNSLEELNTRLDTFLEEKEQVAPQTSLNKIRREILADCRTAAKKTPGLFSLTVPTGGGKTLSVMSFALRHAIQYGKERIIVAIPYTSIIEQNAKIYKYGTDQPDEIQDGAELFGDQNVIEHHNAFLINEDDERYLHHKLATENWDAPIIVTTNVQLFESLYSARPSQCRKLHNIANSVIILDEAQMLPSTWLMPILYSIKQLVDNYGATVVLSTATQPVLSGRIGDPQHGFEGLPPAHEIIPNPKGLAQKLQRTHIKFELEDDQRPTSWSEFADRLLQFPQVLCVVNTRADCRKLFNCMPEGTWHLSASMCPADRSDRIAEIKQALKDGKDARVISTQLIEAGVDIDFPVVFRAEAGLDSIAQSAGRCNREGEPDSIGQVVVFRSPIIEGSKLIGDLRKTADATRAILGSEDFSLADPCLFSRYFSRFYGDVRSFGKEDFEECFQNGEASGKLAYRSFSNKFQLIDDKSQRAVIVRYKNKQTGEDSNKLIQRLESCLGQEGFADRRFLRKLQPYTVTVPERIYHKLVAAGLVIEYEDTQIAIQQEPKLYQEGMGINPECGLSPCII